MIAEALALSVALFAVGVVGVLTRRNALIVFLIVVMIYISLRLEPRMALASGVALAHDVLITIGLYSLVGFTVSPATVIALLTILDEFYGSVALGILLLVLSLVTAAGGYLDFPVLQRVVRAWGDEAHRDHGPTRSVQRHTELAPVARDQAQLAQVLRRDEACALPNPKRASTASHSESAV